MTIEDRNIKLKHLITCMKCEVSGKVCNESCPTQYEAGNMGEIIENLEAISKALEQQPCEDYISREAVLDALHVEGRPTKRFDYVIEVRRDIEALPHVTPKTRMGQWVDDKCSTCGKGIENLIASSEWYRNESPKYCPFCGIKLVEPQESEVKG